MQLDYYLIDTIAPFFPDSRDKVETNWSKIPFSAIEKDARLDPEKTVHIRKAFQAYIDAITTEGYNAISLDDMAHLVKHSFYPSSLNQKIDSYRHFYAELIAYARKKGCHVFITTDILFLNRYIVGYIRNYDCYWCSHGASP